jgi:HEAT repeat protein
MGEGAQRAAIALVKATGDDPSISTWAIAALEELGAPPPMAVGELAQQTKSDQELVAYWAVTLLGRLGPAAAAAETSLLAALTQSPHLAVRERAAWALGLVGSLSADTQKGLRQAAQGSDARLAQLAARALKACGS